MHLSITDLKLQPVGAQLTRHMGYIKMMLDKFSMLVQNVQSGKQIQSAVCTVMAGYCAII